MMWLYQLTGNFGWVIIIASAISKLVLLPLTVKSNSIQRKMQGLQGKLKKLREEHKNDFMTFSQKQMELYRENGVDMKGTYLPMIVQIVIFSLLYKLFQEFTDGSVGSVVVNTLFFGVDLGKPSTSWWLPALSAISQVFIMMLMMPGTTHRDIIPNTKKGKKQALINKEEEDSMMMGMMTQSYMIIFLPVIVFIFSRTFASGLVLYWIVSNTITVGQLFFQFGSGGMFTFIKAIKNSFGFAQQQINTREEKK